MGRPGRWRSLMLIDRMSRMCLCPVDASHVYACNTHYNGTCVHELDCHPKMYAPDKFIKHRLPLSEDQVILCISIGTVGLSWATLLENPP